MNIKTCLFCQTGVAFKPITNAKGEILSTHSICRNPSCPMNKKDLTAIKLKQKKSTKRSVTKKRTTKKKNRFISGVVVGLTSLVLTATALTSFADFQMPSSEITYQAPQIASSSTLQNEITPESLHDKITRYAFKYDIPRESLRALVGCETGWTWDVNIRSKGKLKNGQQENSRGLAQINLDAGHGVTLEQATDPDFSLDFIGKNWSKRHSMWVNCTAKHNL